MKAGDEALSKNREEEDIVEGSQNGEALASRDAECPSPGVGAYVASGAAEGLPTQSGGDRTTFKFIFQTVAAPKIEW